MFQFPVPDIIFSSILPVVLVVLTGIIALIIEMTAPKRDNSLLVVVSILGLGLAAVATAMQLSQPDFDTGSGMVLHDTTGSVLQLILIGCTALSVLFSDRYLRHKRIPFGEFYPLVLWSASGAMLMSISQNLMMIFIGLEILSISLYVMAGMSRSERKSEESAMKYFLLGAFASGFLLYGIALYYGATGTLDLGMAGVSWFKNQGETKLLLVPSCALLLVGLCFKAGLVPFHQWTPDVYQGAPTNVTAFMATASKIGAFAAMLRVLTGFGMISHLWVPALGAIAVLTMVVGNVLALAQNDVKRVLAYSSISHAGYILVALIARGTSGQVGDATLCYYLLSYSFMTLGSFAIISMFTRNGEEETTYSDLRGLWVRSPVAASVLVLFMLSMIGIPPLSGFFGKAFIFMDAIRAGQTPLALVLAVSSVISVAYYLRIALTAVSPEEGDRPVNERTTPFGGTVASAALICAAGILVITIFYAPVMDVLNLNRNMPVPVAATAISRPSSTAIRGS